MSLQSNRPMSLHSPMDASTNMSGMSISMDTTNTDQTSIQQSPSTSPLHHHNENDDDDDDGNDENVEVDASLLSSSHTEAMNNTTQEQKNSKNTHDTEDPTCMTFESWNVTHARMALREATHILSQRGLKLASKWAAEQLIGLAPSASAIRNDVTTSTSKRFDFREKVIDSPIMNTSTPPSLPSSSLYMSSSMGNDLEIYAKSVLDMGEYHRAAAILSTNPYINTTTNNNTNSTSTKTNRDSWTASKSVGKAHGGDVGVRPPRNNLTPYGTFLRAYALYMAGERRKEEEVLELRDPLERTTVTNSYLPQLLAELQTAHVGKTLDAFGLYIYGVVLKEMQKSPSASTTTAVAATVSRPSRLNSIPKSVHSDGCFDTHPSAQSVLIESIIQYPYNWSAWLDLAEICIIEPSINVEVENTLKPISGHWMYYFFCVHSFLENQANEDAIMVMEKLVYGGYDDLAGGIGNNGGFFVSSPYLQTQLAVAHNNLRDFDTAQAHFTRSSECDPHRLDSMDVYSNILYVKEDKVALSNLAHRTIKLDKYRPETCCIVGNYYSLKGQHEKAVQYFQRALKLDRLYLSAWTLMGHEYLEMRNTAAAIEAYRRAVDINCKDYRAWYGLGQIYEIMGMLIYALFYFQKAVEILPNDPRMWCAMGKCFLGLDRRGNAIRAYERAVANNDFEGVATWELATLYNEDGDSEKAARCYLRHLELAYQAQQSQLALPSEGASIQTVISSVNIDEKEAEALLTLAAYHRDRGSFKMASLCCTRLLDYHGHPEREQAKFLLREIKSQENRGRTPARNEESYEFSP